MQTQIGCPDCGSIIHFDTKLLLTGRSFMCSQCRLSISLSTGSQTLVQSAVRGFDRMVAMKEGVGKKAGEHLRKKRG